MRPRLVVSIGSLVAVGCVVLTPGAAAQLSVAQSSVVSAVPPRSTPNLDGGAVHALARVGSWIVAGGSFTTATAPGTSTATTVSGVVAFDQITGALDTAFRPRLNGLVAAVLPGPWVNTVYLCGRFTTVNGRKADGLALMDLSTGAAIIGFKTPADNGAVLAMRRTHGQLLLAGAFTIVAGKTRDGLASLNPKTGALTSYLQVPLTGHHNYNGSGAKGEVGGRALAISPDGTRAVVIGNFKRAAGTLHDQIVMLRLGASSAAVNGRWNTARYTARCKWTDFDSYVRDVAFSPDGSYFVVATTGVATFSRNADGTRSLCDSAARWSSTDTGADVQPTWIDYTGNDSLWSVAVTGTAVYLGGHQRWVNNPNAADQPGAGAVPRPGLVALDPASGLPLTWNPGRHPRGAGAFALLATPAGLYVGSDTNYFGDYRYRRDEIGFFPLVGGYTPAPTVPATLPANVYETGPLVGSTFSDTLAYRPWSSTIGSLSNVPTGGISWGLTRGAFVTGSTIFYGNVTGKFYRAGFNGTSVGTPTEVDPYDDPAWAGVRTGSGQTYQGVKSGYYAELPDITGAFYSGGRLYYTLTGHTALYYRYFSADSGTIGGAEFTVSGATISDAAGMFVSRHTLYVAHRSDGSLHAVAFTNGGTNGQHPSVSGPDTIVSGPAKDGIDWRATSLFLYGPPTTSGP